MENSRCGRGDALFIALEQSAGIEEEGLVAFRYCTPDGVANEASNPNGSARNIAGIFNRTKTVLGLMPHPENAVDPLLGSADGNPLFDGLVEALS